MSPTAMSLIDTPDAKAAHQFLTELRTRISTQPLPYQHGVEARALGSMWEVFGHARDAIKENAGCERFATRATEVLNLVVRPLTAKWHRALEDGRLHGRDGADEFRGELLQVQEALRAFAAELHEMAYGTRHKDALIPEVMTEAAMEELFAPLAFGFQATSAEGAKNAEAIAKDEADAIAKRRGSAVTAKGEDAIGLALSGGGIRSATFGLGVVQVLAERGFLREVDFLSTVSGGGYTGSFLTQRLGSGEDHATIAEPHGPDPEPIRYLRQRARFLSASNLKEKWAMVTATLAGLLLNWTAPLFLIVTCALIISALKAKLGAVAWPMIIAVCGVLCLAAIILYGLGMRRSAQTASVTGRILGLLLAGLGVLATGWLLDSLPGVFGTVREHWPESGGIGAAMALVVAAVPGMIRFLPVFKNPRLRKMVLKIALTLAGLLMPLIALLLFYTFYAIGRDHAAALTWAAVVLAVIAIVVVNINLTAPHRLYRDGLARTFIQNTPGGTPDVKLKDINAGGSAPYHILNAALNVPSSQSPALKDRGCDFFMFSKKWCGSSSVGYHPTEKWKANGGEVDLATAMAVSGAAFSSHMGLGSKPTLTALLTVLNVRLGFWIKKPAATSGFMIPGFLCLLRETFGIGMSEKADWLNLSDGGHIENMGVYELLRRRCKFIICVDGEADPAFTFHGLMTLVRHAQLDFGVRINPGLDDLRPDAETGYSKTHFHLCRIQYPDGVGLLLYIKLAVTGNETELIKRYRINNPYFPHQTTLDQFFDQEQFEAYRQLGVHAADGLFLPALMSGVQPTSVRHWFRQLAKNLLEPLPHA